MKGYQAGIEAFATTDSVVFGVSTDSPETNKSFADSLRLEFAILSDVEGTVSEKYDVLNDEMVSNRTTFVIGKDGIIKYVECGSSALDPAGAAKACRLL